MNSRRPIQSLDPILVDQIKAGEVIGSPSNVLKELMENALDAGCSELSVVIAGDGMELISVEDNGQGIPFHELPLAFTRHATNKLSGLGDLTELTSFGFRGEALASIASVSKITCTTYCPDLNQGGYICIEGGKTLSYREQHSKGTGGTLMRVENLFYNTPVRLKFLKSQAQEKKDLWKVFTSYLLAYPLASFSWRFNEEEKLKFPASANSIPDRRNRVFSKRQSAKDENNWIDFDFEYEGSRLEGFVATQPGSRSNRRQYLICNYRPLNDKLLGHIVKQALAPLWKDHSGQGDLGDYYLHLHLPLAAVDVNVHPEKSQVKFERPGMVHALLHGALSHLKTKISPRVETIPFPGQTAQTDYRPNYSFSPNKTETETGAILEFNLPNTNTKSSWIELDHHTLMKKEGQTELLFLPNYVENILSQLAEEVANKEIATTPLVVSEAYDFSISGDWALPRLNQLGIEIDRLDNQTVALRNWPIALNFINYIAWTHRFLPIFQKKSPDTMAQVIHSMARSIDVSLINLSELKLSAEKVETRGRYLHTLAQGDLAKAFFSEFPVST